MSETPIFNFTDSADHYADADLGKKWTSTFNANRDPNGRNGSGIKLTQGFIAPGSVTINLFPEACWLIGFAYNLGPSSGIVPNSTIFNAQVGHQSVLILRMGNDNTLYMFAAGGSPEVLIGVGPILQQNTWYFIEMIIKDFIPDPIAHPNSPITVTGGLQVDGKLYFDVTSVASNLLAGIFAAGSPGYDTFSPSSGGQSFSYTDDIYILSIDGASTMSAGYKDASVKPSFPISDIANTDGFLPAKWNPKPSPPALHYNLVNDNPPDGGSTTIQFVGNPHDSILLRQALDLYLYDNVPTTDNLYVVNMLFMGDGANEVIDPVIGFMGASDGTSSLWIGGDIPAELSIGFNWVNTALLADPVTSLPWDPGNYNSYNMGVLYPLTNTM